MYDAPLSEPKTQKEGIDLGAALKTLWRGKGIIATCTLLCTGAALLYLAIAPVIYRADALLHLEEKTGQLALPDGLSGLMDNAPRSITEIEILRSRLVLGQAVADLHLDWHAAPRQMPIVGRALTRFDLPLPDLAALRPFARQAETIRLGLLQVPSGWLNTPMTLTKITAAGYRVTLPNGGGAWGKH